MKKCWLLFLLLFSFPTFAQSEQVRKENGFYWVDVKIASLPKSYERRVAVLKAKSLLAKHLNLPKNTIEIKYKDIVKIHKKRNAKVAIYTFKISKQNVKIP